MLEYQEPYRGSVQPWSEGKRSAARSFDEPDEQEERRDNQDICECARTISLNCRRVSHS